MTDPISRLARFAVLACAVALLPGSGCAPEPTGGIEASGTIEATEASLAVKVPGRLTAVLPAEGDPVDSAQVLARVDDSDLRWQRAQAEAARDLAQAHLEMAVNGPRPEELAQARAARADLDRAQALAATGTATPKQLEDARARWETTAAARDQARQDPDSMET